jgi:acyl-[acyl-carrier-protein]-phospholipid O-acyltransferase/long-chain-fatty-acid--[acyl-carrier-protein] ligase
LHTLSAERVADLLKKLPQLGLPNLWIPRPNQFFHVDVLPFLATGKRDLRSLREIATRLSSEQSTQE